MEPLLQQMELGGTIPRVGTGISVWGCITVYLQAALNALEGSNAAIGCFHFHTGRILRKSTRVETIWTREKR
jgi:hypothetical protein